MEDKKKAKYLFFALAGAILFGYTVFNFSNVMNIFGALMNILFPLILGIAIAFILNIPMDFFERKFTKIKKQGVRRGISLFLSIVIIIAILVFVIRLVVPQIGNAFSLLMDKTPYLLDQFKIISSKILENQDIVNAINNINIDTESIKNMVTSNIDDWVGSSISIFGNFIKGITNVVIALIFAFYILMGKEKILAFCKKTIIAFMKEEKANYIFRIAKLTDKTFRNFTVGQCTEAVILGVLCIIGMLILRLPYAITIGTLVGLTSLIPLVGAFIGVGVGALLIAVVSPMKAIVFIVFFLILQQIEGNLIYPKVVGSAVGVPGILVLFAVLIGGSLFGIVGMLIGLPVVSILYSIFKEFVDKKYNKKLELKNHILDEV